MEEGEKVTLWQGGLSHSAMLFVETAGTCALVKPLRYRVFHRQCQHGQERLWGECGSRALVYLCFFAILGMFLFLLFLSLSSLSDLAWSGACDWSGSCAGCAVGLQETGSLSISSVSRFFFQFLHATAVADYKFPCGSDRR